MASGNQLSAVTLKSMNVLVIDQCNIQYRFKSKYAAGIIQTLNTTNLSCIITNSAIIGYNLIVSEFNGYLISQAYVKSKIIVENVTICQDNTTNTFGISEQIVLVGIQKKFCENICKTGIPTYGLCQDQIQNGIINEFTQICLYPFIFLSNKCICDVGYTLNISRCVDILETLTQLDIQIASNVSQIYQNMQSNISKMNEIILYNFNTVDSRIYQNISNVNNLIANNVSQLYNDLNSNFTYLRTQLIQNISTLDSNIQKNSTNLQNIISDNFKTNEYNLQRNTTTLLQLINTNYNSLNTNLQDMKNSLLQQMTQLNSNTLNYASSTYLKQTDFNSRTQQLTQNLQSYSQTQATNALNQANTNSYTWYQSALQQVQSQYALKTDLFSNCLLGVCDVAITQNCHSGGGGGTICSKKQYRVRYFVQSGSSCICK
ncbi:Conserved_hypothetical protein [Hexamita inflata]|uniref:Uncharacterized protein n=1 Tax=Hexamita inflata TaxID=28002 RepID=A0AA86NP35_9EUKA|nr:Conserved hypothetical protein [Hexamita inflata]